VLLLSVPAARAEEPDVKIVCADEHEQGQRLRNAGKLRGARAAFASCTRDACPVLARKACADLLLEVENLLPTVVVDARDASGNDIADVRVLVDGEVVRERLDGMEIGLDPGEHVFRFETPGRRPVEQRVVLGAAAKQRRLSVVFDVRVSLVAAPGVPPSRGEARTSPFVYVLGGVGVVALGSFTYFAVAGKSLENGRSQTCGSDCTDAEVAPVRRDYLAADISLGAAVVAVAAAVWLFTHPGPASPRNVNRSHLRLEGVW
jgi:hypothetical protein